MKPLLAMALAGALALAACGGGGDSADTKLAERALVVRSDLPAGWTVRKENDAPKARPCPSGKRSRSSASGHADGAGFQSRPTGQTTSVAYVFSDEAGAKAAYRDLASDGTFSCVGSRVFDALERTVGKVTKLGNQIRTDRPVRAVGEQRILRHLTNSYGPSGIEDSVGTDFVIVRQGRGVVVLTFIGAHASFDEALRHRVTGRAATRLRDALATH